MSKRYGSGNCVSSKSAEMNHMTTLSPAASARPASSVGRVAVRRKCIVTVPQRRISSTAVSMSARPWRSASSCSGCSMSASIPWVIV